MIRKFSFWTLLAIIVVILILFYRVMITFLVPIFLAVLLVVIFRPLHGDIRKKCRGRNRLAAAITTAAVMVIVLLPTILVLTLAAKEGADVIAQMDVPNMKSRLAKLRQSLDLEMPLARPLRRIEGKLVAMSGPNYKPANERLHEVDVDRLLLHVEELDGLMTEQQKATAPTSAFRAALIDIKRTPATTLEFDSAVSGALAEFRRFKTSLLGGSSQAWLKELANPTDEQLEQINQRLYSYARSHVLSLTGAAGKFVAQFVIGLVIMCVAIYFFFADGPTMLESITRLSPLDDRYEQELFDDFVRASRAVVLASLVSAVVQGVLAGIGFWIAGMDSVFLLVLLTMVFALIPFFGAAAVWIPSCMWLYFYEERTLAAVLLALYGTGIISMSDNVVKPLILHGQSGIHPLLALLSVLGGVQALGPIGILVGPMVVVFLQTLLNILHRELTAAEQETYKSPAPDSS